MIKTAVIGVGIMGRKYVDLIMNEKIDGLELVALTRTSYNDIVSKASEKNIPIFHSDELLFEAIEKGSIDVDAVVIATPHYAHEKQAVRAFKNGINVLSDKPAGVYVRQARVMEEAAQKNKCVYGMVFNQRTNPIYKRIREIIKSGIYGKLKRVNWVVTDWYRPDTYFAASKWHATWTNDGGGVLLNQCPHNLDLLSWMCGMPKTVQAFCLEGHYHPIEVEDDVTMYMQWENGAVGSFITSTGDVPGVNRLEISLEEAMLVCQDGKLMIGEIFPELLMKEKEYKSTAKEFFRKIKGTWKALEFTAPEEPYKIVLQAFADECVGKGECIAKGSEGMDSLLLSNAAYLSSWKECKITIPKRGTKEMLSFEREFEEYLERKIEAEKKDM